MIVSLMSIMVNFFKLLFGFKLEMCKELNNKIIHIKTGTIGDMIRLWKSNKEIGLFIITKGIKDKNILSIMMEMA